MGMIFYTVMTGVWIGFFAIGIVGISLKSEDAPWIVLLSPVLFAAAAAFNVALAVQA